MALPNPVQRLKHGVLLCKKNFRTFVETFNFIVDFIENLRGDGDGNGAGKIKLDRTIPDRPVIRFTGSESSQGSSSYTPNPSPFDIETIDDAQTVVRGTFYWDGELKTVSNYAIPDGSTDVYLIATQDVGSSGAEPSWTFQLSNTAGTPSSSQRVQNFKLYSFVTSQGVTNVTDYRTTFLTMSSPHQVRHFKVAKPDTSDGSITLDASSSQATMTVGDGDGNSVVAASSSSYQSIMTSSSSGMAVEIQTGSSSASIFMTNMTNSVTINPANLTEGNAQFHKLTVNKANGTTAELDILSSNDQTIDEPKIVGDILKDVTVEYSAGSHSLTITKKFVNLYTGTETTQGPTTIFTAVPHSTDS